MIRRVDHRRIKRHGIRQIINGNQLVHQRLARGHIEGVDDAQDDTQENDVKRLNPTRQRERRENDRLQQRRALGPDGDPVR